ncbi:putative secreted protein (Por secretion system target) [Marinoscillum furvescens DSM 4134]|uniref:Putative secreted protein (Por secretion system target) n=2 Tax=Marinoscillum furvescens TaxID=1026 RepID=A0A3D9L066_MARFU|nr:putative secreted protein (Por secretion system target) [Marinoscillum furvescens DSM 4134]
MVLQVAFLWAAKGQDRYMVFFSDKDNVPYSLEQPDAFLSDRAIARRSAQGIAITVQDLPVDTEYVAQVEGEGADVFFTSRWFNAALVQMDDTQRISVTNLPFVDSVTYIAKGAVLSHDLGGYEVPQDFLDPDRVSGNSHTQLTMLGAKDMHEDGFTGEGKVIAVFDAGFPGVNVYKPFEHIFTENRLIGTKDFIRNSGNVFQYNAHGTAVLSCIGGMYEEVFSGTAPDASYILCVTEDVENEYRIEEYNWLLAAEYADSAGADVINASLGYSTFSDGSMDYTYQDMNGKNTIVARAASYAADRGIVVVVSAGNEGNGSWKYITSPGDADDVLTVGSVDSRYERSGFSSFGPTADGRIKPDVSAMGTFTSIFTVGQSRGEVVSGMITTGNGTSFAAPQIAGFAAATWQANPDWNSQQVIESIKLSGSNADEPNSEIGYGVPKYESEVPGAFTVYPNPFKDNMIFVEFGNVEIKGRLTIDLQDTKGNKIFSTKLSARDRLDRIEIEVKPSENGTYFLTLHSRGFKKTVKLIKI